MRRSLSRSDANGAGRSRAARRRRQSRVVGGRSPARRHAGDPSRSPSSATATCGCRSTSSAPRRGRSHRRRPPALVGLHGGRLRARPGTHRAEPPARVWRSAHVPDARFCARVAARLGRDAGHRLHGPSSRRRPADLHAPDLPGQAVADVAASDLAPHLDHRSDRRVSCRRPP